MVQETNVYVSKIKNMSSFLIKINIRRKKNKFPKKMYFTSSVWYGTGVKNFVYLHSPGAGLVLHVDLEAQLALEGDDLLVHAGHLLNFRMVLKVDGNV